MDKPAVFQLALSVPGRARADVRLTPGRIYYRFATADTVDDGDRPGLRDGHAELMDALVCNLVAEPLRAVPEGVVATASVDDSPAQPLSGNALEGIVNRLIALDEAFLFMQGFL